MFPDYHSRIPLVDRAPKPDWRPIPCANEIRMRVKRELNQKEA